MWFNERHLAPMQRLCYPPVVPAPSTECARNRDKKGHKHGCILQWTCCLNKHHRITSIVYVRMYWHHCPAWSPSLQPFQSPPVSHACVSHESQTCLPLCIPPTLTAPPHSYLALRTTGIRKHRRDFLQVNPTHQVHLPAVNLKDLQASLDLTPASHAYHLVGIRELDLPVDSTRPKQGRIQNINTISRHDDLDAVGWLEAVQLVQQLHHRSLYLILASVALAAGAADAIDLIHEDETWLVFSAGETARLAYLALMNSSRTMRAPSPMYFCTSSDPLRRIKEQSV